MTKAPIRVAVTGAAGQIGYTPLFRTAAGEILGKDQPVILQLLEIPDEEAQKALKDVMMKIEDCAFPPLADMEVHSDPIAALKDVDVVLLAGARPHGPGMEYVDLLSVNTQIFTAQGKALNAVASRNVKVLMVGNPANANAYVVMKSTPDLSRENSIAMLHLDHNRASSQITVKTGKPVSSIEKLFVQGDHDPTMYTNYRYTTIDGRDAKDMINDPVWNDGVFLPAVDKRGAAIIEARGLSSAASATSTIIDHVHDRVLGSNGKIVTMDIPSNSEYGTPKGVMFGLPVTTENDRYKIVEGLEVDEYSQGKIRITLDKLEAERADVQHLL